MNDTVHAIDLTLNGMWDAGVRDTQRPTSWMYLPMEDIIRDAMQEVTAPRQDALAPVMDDDDFVFLCRNVYVSAVQGLSMPDGFDINRYSSDMRNRYRRLIQRVKGNET